MFHNLENWDEFTNDPIGALLSFSGLTIYGGLIVAAIAVIRYGKKNNINSLHLVDAAAPMLMIAYAVGRIGCHVSGDGDWGINNPNPMPSWLGFLPDWLWSYRYPHNVNSVGVLMENCDWGRYCYQLPVPVYPTPLYETTMCLVLFAILWSLRKRLKAPGMLFSLYILFNGIERFFIEKIRVNTLYDINGFTFTQAELISSIFIIAGLISLWYFYRLNKLKVSGSEL